MKKLMTAIAAVTAAFGLYAAAPTTGTSFEALTADAPFDATKDDQGGDNASFWSSTETEIGTVKAYAGDAYTGTRPTQFLNETQANYLELETSAPLTRWANSDKTTAYAIEDTGLYFDQLVKFTAPSDGETTIDLAGGKIAIWLKEVEADATAEPAVVAATNLMITAGFFEAADTIKQNDYTATIDGSTLVGDWHRVTIKAIKITDAYAGFVVYIDGTAVVTVDSIGTKPALNALGTKYADLGELFPSAVIEGGYAQTISAVAFNGSGAIDDVSFTAVVPDFAKDEITFNLDWTPAAFTSITAGGQVLNVADGSTNLVLSGDTTSLAIAAVANGDYTVSLKAGDGAAIDPNDDMTFNFGGPASGSIVSQFNYFEVNGTTYPTFAAALAAAQDNDTISLNADCTLSAADVGDAGIAVNKAVTLDLAGNDLLVSADSAIFYVEDASALTVVNSGDNDAKIGMADTVVEPSAAIFALEGALTIGTTENEDNFVVVEGVASEGNDPVIYQGKLAKNLNDEPMVEDGYEVTSDANYWIVQKEQEEETITVTIGAADTNAKIQSVLSNDVSVAYVAGTYVIPAGQSLTVTYAANTGYEFEPDVTTKVFVLDEDKEESTCPAATPITYNITYTFTGVEVGDVAKIVNPNAGTTTYTVESATITFEAASCDGYEFKGFSPASIATGTTGDQEIVGTFEKADEPMPDPIEDPDQKAAYKEWLKNATFAEGKTDAIYADYFAIKLTDIDVSFAGGDVEKAAADKLASIITADMVNQIVAKGFENVDFSALAEEYPNAEFSFVEATEIEAEEGVSGFYRLNVAFKPAND